MEKFKRVCDVITERSNGDKLRILDIGCRRQGLRPYVEHLGAYDGADLFQTGSVKYVGDFTKGLPVADLEYDVTVALDVIEHTNEMTAALDEMMRVTRKFSVIVLPNHAHWSFRLRFLLVGTLSEKWTVEYPLREDRHRWLTTATQSNAFMDGYARSRGYRLEQCPSKIGRLGPMIERTLGQLWPDFWDKNQLYVLWRQDVGGRLDERAARNKDA